MTNATVTMSQLTDEVQEKRAISQEDYVAAYEEYALVVKSKENNLAVDISSL